MLAEMVVQTRASDLAAISALVTRVNSSLDLHQVLDQAIAVCAELSGCEGALVYLWDDEQERLVVHGAIEGYTEWIGRFSLAMGEGLTGWTALTRRVGIITEDPRTDPRYRHVPELHDERFQSVATVPVVGRAEQLLGVLTLHTEAPHEFSESDVSLLRTIAGLVAGAVENAQLHQQALRSVEVFRRLSDLSQRMTGASPRETLQRLAMTTLELFDGRLAAVLRLDERRDRLLVEAWAAGDDARLRTGSLPASGEWGRLLGGVACSRPLDDAPELALRPDVRSSFAAPLRFQGRPTGLVVCQATGVRALSADNLELLATIANHAAVAMEEDRRRTAAARRLEARDLFDALRAGDRRALDRPHVVVQADADPGDPDRLWNSLSTEIVSAFPGTLVDARAQELAALVPVASETWQPRLEALLARTLPPGAGAGISDAAQDDPPMLFRQARIAATIARSDGAAVRSYGSLGAQRHLWTISREDDPDPLERAVARLADVDARRGSQLFRTLEVYLEQHGNGRRAAEVLFIHRNTLRQRLRKIGELVGRDVREPGGWFELGLAVRLVRFRGGGDPSA
jgi:GAF domain-containing protein